jgi:predicted transcriptional regulator
MMVPMGNQLAAGRRALGISQQSLAELAGCHRVMIARIESHNDQSGPAYPLARQAVRDVLERRGVAFFADGSGVVCRLAACMGGVDVTSVG